MHLRKTLSKPKDTLLFINSLLFLIPGHIIFAVAPETKETWNRNTNHNLTETINNRWRDTCAGCHPCTGGAHQKWMLTHQPADEDTCPSRSRSRHHLWSTSRTPRTVVGASGHQAGEGPIMGLQEFTELKGMPDKHTKADDTNLTEVFLNTVMLSGLGSNSGKGLVSGQVIQPL